VNMDRRELMRNIALLLGAATVPTPALCKVAARTKGFLTAGQKALLVAICDTIIPATDTPGAVAAQVPQQIDGMLASWASKATQAELVNAIEAIGTLAENFAALAPKQRKALLLPYDAQAVKPGPAPRKQHVLSMMMGPPIANAAYVRLKGLIINLYYASEIAMTRELIYEHNPGPFEPSIKITAQSRPPAGLGGLFG
jgi:gluconate 2-dehydrogenase gamma chain